METELDTQVAIIGAGPTGLSMACQLQRYGIDFVIVDSNESITPFSKAIGVQARTLEIYEQMGLAQTAIDQGTIAGKVQLVVGGEVRGELDLSTIGHGLSDYPYLLLLEQSKNEAILYEHLRDSGHGVLWGTTFKGLTQDDAGVSAQLTNKSGASQILTAKYLVGCDGAKSPVRKAIGHEFGGSTFERMFYVADVQIDWGFSHDALRICLGRDNVVLFFPLKGENRYRIVGNFPEDFEKDEGEVLYEEIAERIRTESKLTLHIHDVSWFSTYKVHTRHVDSFSEGRCFLAGDSAHIHSPAGAQGMNTGIQDAYNLGWKVAFVLAGKANERLLDTYNEERLDNAKHLLRTTDRLFEFGAGSEWLLAFLRTEVLPAIAGPILSIDAVKNFVFPLISQIGIEYRDSTLSVHTDDKHFKVKDGDRMPYIQIDGKSIYSRLAQPRFHLLIVSDSRNTAGYINAWLESKFSDLADVTALTMQPEIVRIFGTDRPFCVLVRPDNYIGCLSAEVSVKLMNDYLDEIMSQPQNRSGQTQGREVK